MSPEALIEFDRSSASQTRHRGKPTVGSGVDTAAGLFFGLNSAGNAAIARVLAPQRQVAREHRQASEPQVQRCGPVPCNCSAEERSDYAAKHPEDEHESEPENPVAVGTPLQRLVTSDRAVDEGAVASDPRAVASEWRQLTSASMMALQRCAGNVGVVQWMQDLGVAGRSIVQRSTCGGSCGGSCCQGGTSLEPGDPAAKESAAQQQSMRFAGLLP